MTLNKFGIPVITEEELHKQIKKWLSMTDAELFCDFYRKTGNRFHKPGNICHKN
jgi:hypothetical protein